MSIGCCDSTTVSLQVSTIALIVGDHVQTSNVKVPAGVAIMRGDLLKVDDDNIAALASDPSDWDGISVFSLSAEQTTYHAAQSLETGIYTQGEFAVAAVTLAGVPLAPDQYDAARACGTRLNIELRKEA